MPNLLIASNLQLQIELILVDDQIPSLNIWMAHQHAICHRSQRCHLDQSECLDDTWPVMLAPLLITYYFLYGCDDELDFDHSYAWPNLVWGSLDILRRSRQELIRDWAQTVHNYAYI